MQQLQYRPPASVRIHAALLAAFMTAYGIYVLITTGGVGKLIAFSVLVASAAYYNVVVTLRSAALTVDDAGFRRRKLFGTSVTPWSLVQSFEALPGSKGRWYVVVKLSTGKYLGLPRVWPNRGRAEEVVAELAAAHSEYLAATR